MSNRQRILANVAQFAFLLGAFLLASRDVERTMHQKPVTPEQNAAIYKYFDARQQPRVEGDRKQ